MIIFLLTELLKKFHGIGDTRAPSVLVSEVRNLDWCIPNNDLTFLPLIPMI